MRSSSLRPRRELSLPALLVLMLLALPLISVSQVDATARVQELKRAAQQIDAENDNPTPGERQLSVSVSHWDLEGLFVGSSPRLLTARLTEGSAVTEETYYLADGKLFLVKVEKYWDVENERAAPQRPTLHEVFLDAGKVLQHRLKTGDPKASSRNGNAGPTANLLTSRSGHIAQALLRSESASTTLAALEQPLSADLLAAPDGTNH